MTAVHDRSADLPPLPNGQVTLIGGTVARMDPIRDRITLRAFGGPDVTIDFDVRTCLVRGDTPVSMREIRPGTRVYADTILKDGRIFAKTLRVATNPALGEARGQVTDYDPGKELLRVRDAISSQALTLRVLPRTAIEAATQPGNARDLINGALVRVLFQSASEGPSVAEMIEILARPGTTFTFAGRIVSVDLRNQYLTLTEPGQQNTFEVGLESLPPDVRALLKEGADVVVRAQFDGSNYKAQSIEPAPIAHP